MPWIRRWIWWTKSSFDVCDSTWTLYCNWICSLVKLTFSAFVLCVQLTLILWFGTENKNWCQCPVVNVYFDRVSNWVNNVSIKRRKRAGSGHWRWEKAREECTYIVFIYDVCGADVTRDEWSIWLVGLIYLFYQKHLEAEMTWDVWCYSCSESWVFTRKLHSPFFSTVYHKEINELRTDFCFIPSTVLQSSKCSGMLFDLVLLLAENFW